MSKIQSDLVTRRTLALAGVAMVSGLALPATAAETTHEPVVRSVEALRRAMLGADKSGLDTLLGRNLSFGHSNGVVQTKGEFMEAVLGRKEVFKSITLTEQTVRVVGPSAIVRQTFASDLELEGKPLSVKLGELQVWQKQGNAWFLIARQAFKA
jgi:hypothetical protein